MRGSHPKGNIRFDLISWKKWKIRAGSKSNSDPKKCDENF